MKPKVLFRNSCWAAAFAALAGAMVFSAAAAEERVIETRLVAQPRVQSDEKPEKGRERIIIEKVEKDEAGEGAKQVPWLGVATEETSEALAAQLGLNAGEGLTVTYVADESPAAKAGLQRNDVLTEFEDQLLVHPAQLRKLIQLRKEGDGVKLTIFRAGKKETLTATIAKGSPRSTLFHDERSFQGDLQDLHRHLRELPLGDAARESMKHLRESLQHLGVEKEVINKEVKRSMEEVRKALQETLRHATNAHRTFGPAAREFRELARRGLDVEKDATVIVKSKRNSVKTMVKTDESGTYVLVADPKQHLTAHSKSGELLFEGSIETEDQQSKVPKAVWEKVKPMLEQLNEDKEEQPKAEEESSGG